MVRRCLCVAAGLMACPDGWPSTAANVLSIDIDQHQQLALDGAPTPVY